MRLKLLFSALAASLMLLAPAAPALAAGVTNPLGAACKGLATSGSVCDQNKAQNGKTSNPALHKIQIAVNAMAIITGAAAIIIIIYSGLVYATAGGAATGQRAGDNPARAKNARSTLTGAVIGLLIVALAWTIVTFVSNKVIKS